MKHILVILFISFSVKSQIKIIDSSNQKPISSVEIYNKHGVLIFTSDDHGMTPAINTDEYPIYLSHFLYQDLELKSLEKLCSLNPKSVILNNVDVNTSALKFVILEGYYRGFQTKNDSLDIFVDAKIKWIVSNKDYKHVGYEVLESRYYLSKKYNYYKQGKIYIGMKLNTLPIMQNDITKFKSHSHAKDIVVFEYDHNSEKEIKFMGNSSVILINRDELISSSESNYFENLIFFSHKHKLTLKSKKSIGVDSYEALNEFIPSNIYLSNDLPKNLQKRIIIRERSNYKTEYWEQFERNPNFKVISPVLVNALYSTMELIK